MEFELFSILALGFLLGIKHAIEPDHVIAISTIASRSESIWKSSLAGVFWGIGHTLTLFIVGILIMLMKLQISDVMAMSLEFVVGIMLVYLGLMSFKHVKRHQTNHKDTKIGKNTYAKSMGIGFVHGLAGSAAMIILTMSTVDQISEAVLYIIIFGFGTIVSMLGFTMLIGFAFVVAKSNSQINKGLVAVVGCISTVFGLYYMYNLGVNDGLFQLWFF
jgi:sulfite exporter TauE/SafE